MRRNDPCFCGSGRKYKKCHYQSEIHPESRGAELLKLYNGVDREVAKYGERHHVQPPCHRGCSECCYQIFEVSQLEFETIMYEIKRDWSQEEIEVLFDRAFECLEAVKKENPNLIDILDRDANEEQDLFIEQVFAARDLSSQPCPFLDKQTGACRVYEVRPMVCRQFGSSHIREPQHGWIFPDQPLCSKISSRKEVEEKTPDVTEHFEQYRSLKDLKFPGVDKAIPIREYPIFYWLKILYDKNGEKKEAGSLEIDYNVTVSKEEGLKKLLSLM